MTNNSFIKYIEQKQLYINKDEQSITENGMVGYKTTNHPILDTFFSISSFRNKKDIEIIEAINKIMNSNDSEYILKLLFLLRDIRNGLGERRFFRVALKEVLKYEFDNKDEIIKSTINNLINEYGRFDDLLVFLDTPYEYLVINKIKNQLKEDYKNYQANVKISLLAKWLPSENTSCLKTRNFARKIINALNITPREYRKTLSLLREYLKVCEVLLSSKRYNEIDYQDVPSLANIRYATTFYKHDMDRRISFLEAIKNGDSTVHINSSINFPHEIVSQMRYENNIEVLEELWKNLKQVDGLKDTIVVRDGSGSMTSRIGKSNTTALDVSTALSIYCAERLNGFFKNRFITFSEKAKLVTLPNTSLKDNLEKCYEFDDCSNTNIQNVFELILNTAVKNKLSNDELPKQILIISDMEFDFCTNNSELNVFLQEQQKYKDNGFIMPKLVFWNVCSRTNTIPLKENDKGVLLVSGFSVNIINMISSEERNPYNVLINELSSNRYEDVPLLKNIRKKNVTKDDVCKKFSYKPSWL